MTKKEKSAKKIRPMLIVEIAFLVFLAIGAIICFNGMFKGWHIFTEKRIETLEEIFDADFSDDTEFEYYSYVYQFQGGETHILYIKNIDDPEKFYFDNFDSENPILIADIKNSKVIENEIYTELGVEDFFERSSTYNQPWRNGERSVDFIYRIYSKKYLLDIYFSQNSDGKYDAKLINI